MKLDSLCFCSVGNVINVEDHLVVEQPTQLRSSWVRNCKDIEWVHHIPWKSLTSLATLDFERMQEMEDLPDGIQHLTCLGNLWILGCEKLRTILLWLPHLTSLKCLMIVDCSEELIKRCQREKGEDWPLISHIPEINIKTREDYENQCGHNLIEARHEEEEDETRKIGWCGLTR